MPFRNSGAFGSQQYGTFADPNGFEFTYDMGSDGLLDPYSFPLMSPDASWTPASQQFAASNLSDSLSPMGVADFATPPQDQDLQFPQSAASDPGRSDEHATARRAFSEKQQTPGTMNDYDSLFHGQKRDASFLGADSTAPPVTNVSSASVNLQKQMLSNSANSPDAVPIKSRQSSSDASPEGSHEDVNQSPSDNGAAARLRTTDTAKVRHNIVERRYRENINAQVDVLRESIVATVHAKEEQQGVSASRLGADELKRLTKAAVIGAATKQIRRARTENERLLEEHRALQAQVQELESLVKCGDCPLMKLTVDLSLNSPTQAT